MTRRGLLPWLPALASLGVMPWHIEPEPPLLTLAELFVFKMWIDRDSGDDPT